MSQLFKQYPNMTEYYETSDGQKFFKEEPAKTHARTLKDKKVTTVPKPEESEDNEGSKQETAKEIIAKLPEMDLAIAQDYLAAEESLEAPRKTVTDALQKRIAELQKPA